MACNCGKCRPIEQKYEECANLCFEYKERFGENVPFFMIAFYDFDTISENIRKALKTNKKIIEE